ncbi:MAG: pseudaminic acid synthase, partial [Arcticibacterium sp.]
DDIELALKTCRAVGNNDITLLKCTSQYPASIDQANLSTMVDMRKRFGVKVGVSDHTMGSLVPTVAVALGAKVIEKHFILDRNLGGPDSSFSMEPHEFAQMVRSVREAELSLGNINYEVAERDKLRRRSLFIVQDIKAGEVITEENVRSIRPGFGLHPRYFKGILGKRVNKHLFYGDPVNLKSVNDD